MINIDDLIGVRYKKNGRDKKGFDCYGLAMEVSKRMGNNLPDLEIVHKDNYDFQECHKAIIKEIKVKQVPEPQKEGDLILIEQLHGVMSHIGVYLGNRQVIHCDRHGTHIDRLERLHGMIGKVYTWL